MLLSSIILDLFSFEADLIIQVAYYSGAENPVTYSRIFKNTFACVFDLKKYPFDTQVGSSNPLCLNSTLNLRLSGKSEQSSNLTST